MNKRISSADFIGVLVLGVSNLYVAHFLVMLFGMVFFGFPLAHAQQPNIVLIMADNIGREAFSSYGSQPYDTPNIDRLAREGMRFTQMHTQPLCAPSRLQFVTGRHLHRARAATRILPQVMQDAGYVTGLFGKWHLESWWPFSRADFDEFFSLIRNRNPRYWGPRFTDNGTVRQFDSDVFGPDLILDEVISFMERHRSQRFFIAYHMLLNHQPSVRVPGAPASGSRRQRHIEMTEYADSNVGIVMENLQRLGLANNTMVIFTTDGGSEPRAGAVQVNTPQGTISVTGGFGLPTDAGTHIPFIVRWPGQTPAGRVNNNIVDSTSILPTLAAIAGASIPSGVDGYSLLPQLRGGTSAPRNWIYMWYDPNPIQSSNFGNEASEFAQDSQGNKLYRYHRCGDTAFFNTTADLKEQNPISRSAATSAQRASWDRLLAVIQQAKPAAVRPSSCS